MTDQQRATASHLYGNSFCQTPEMARLANSGVLFENAITPHPLCVPARVSFWTSQFPRSHGVRGNETLMPEGAVHAFQIWKQAGYKTGLIGKNHCFETEEDLRLFDVWNSIGHGNRETELTRGMPWYRPADGRIRVQDRITQMKPQNHRASYAVSDLPLEDHSSGLIAGQTVRYLENHRNEPFALWVSFPDPHEPWMVPEKYASLFPPESIDLPPWRQGEFADERSPERNRVLYQMLGLDGVPIEDIYGMSSVYFGMVRFIDDSLGKILDALEALGLEEKTIVVFCSDHGDFMGEHRMQCKGGVFYDSLTRVPLIVSWPGNVKPGVVESSMSNLTDVVPTLLSLQGIEIPSSMHGMPLPVVTDTNPREATFSEYGAGGPPFTMADLQRFPKPWGRETLIDSLRWREAEGRRKMVRTREWKYVHDPMGDQDELYNLDKDPWELENVAREETNMDILTELKLRLVNWSIGTEDSTPVPPPGMEHYRPN